MMSGYSEDAAASALIGAKIRSLRKRKGLTLTQLSELAGVAKSYLSSIERGIQNNPSIQFLEKVSFILDVSVEQFWQPVQEKEVRPPKLDREWQELIREAMRSGLTKKQFREYMEFTKWKKNRGGL